MEKVTSGRGLCQSNLLLSFLGYVPSVPATGGEGDDGLTWYQYWFGAGLGMHMRRESCMLRNQGWGTPGFAYARNCPQPLLAHFHIVTVLHHSLCMDVTLHPSRNAS